MREFRTYGSVRGAPSNGRPYRNPRPSAAIQPFAESGPSMALLLSRNHSQVVESMK